MSARQIAAQTARTPVELPLAVSTAPERIWLQIGDDQDYLSEPFPYSAGEEITWCQDSVVAAEVKYIRADIAKAAHDDLVAALRECSEYLSDIPESAAGGDDEAGRLVRMAAAALNKAGSL
jgi:hypothetical protein